MRDELKSVTTFMVLQFLVFSSLKMAGAITWDWLWVASPLWFVLTVYVLAWTGIAVVELASLLSRLVRKIVSLLL